MAGCNNTTTALWWLAPNRLASCGARRAKREPLSQALANQNINMMLSFGVRVCVHFWVMVRLCSCQIDLPTSASRFIWQLQSRTMSQKCTQTRKPKENIMLTFWLTGTLLNGSCLARGASWLASKVLRCIHGVAGRPWAVSWLRAALARNSVHQRK